METAGSNLPVAVLFTLPVNVDQTIYMQSLTLLEAGSVALAVTLGLQVWLPSRLGHFSHRYW